MRKFRLGLIVNPYAGIGGALGLKGSDGADIRAQALSAGAEQKAMQRMQQCLSQLDDLIDQIEVFTAAGDMGERVAKQMGLSTQVVYQPASVQTEATDTEACATLLLQQQIDLLLFAGGDGTARNICAQVHDHTPVLGVPAGCKIHSGVYAVTPAAAGRVLRKMVLGELVSLRQADVKDIDEQAFRSGRVVAKAYGELAIPADLEYIQATKMGGRESEELVLADIAEDVIERMQAEPETLFVMGSGSTVNAVMEQAGLANTLLGVDVVQNLTVIAADVSAAELLSLIQGASQTRLVITLIGGQGHVFGRGNQQLSPAVIRAIGRDNILLIATKAKIQALQQRPLISDCGDPALDRALSGSIPVLCGYQEQVLYPLRSPGNDDDL